MQALTGMNISAMLSFTHHATNLASHTVAGVDPGFIKGGAQIHCSEHDNCVRSTRSGMRSMPNLGGLWACPPENFEKLDPLRLNLRALLMVCYFYY